jgi:predicted nucleic acid-binding protein
MIVIADTSPINHLVLIDAIGILPEMFGEVIIPDAVCEELKHRRAPEPVRRFINEEHSWLIVKEVEVPANTGLDDLGPGERSAIFLAETEKADLLIIDERKGMRAAVRRNLTAAGTVFLLEQAAQKNLIDLFVTFERLKKTSFHISHDLLNEILYRNS